jgi:hypothetical protein
MDWFRSLPAYRRKIYLLLIVAILLTLPCYCIGLALLIQAPEETAPPSGSPGGSELSREAVSLWGAAASRTPIAAAQPVGDGPTPARTAAPLPYRSGFGLPIPAAP